MTFERFKSTEISEILRLVDESARNKLKDDITKSVSKEIDKEIDRILGLRPLLFNRDLGELMKSDMPTVSFRRETVQKIFQMFYNHIRDKAAYTSLLFDEGRKVGAGFSMDLMKFFMKQRKIPWNYSDFLAFWTEFDSTAGWGLISVTQFDPERLVLNIKVDNSFLVDKSDSHIHCPFFGGYIFGILEMIFDFVFKTLERDRYELPVKRLIPKDFEHTRGSDCFFNYTFVEIKSIRSFDEFYNAIVASLDGKNLVTVKSLKTSIEFICKEKLDLRLEDTISFDTLLKSLGKIIPTEINYKNADECYSKLSEILYGFQDLDETKISELIKSTHHFMLQAERLALSMDQKTDAKKNLKIEHSTREEMKEELKHLHALLEKYQPQSGILSTNLTKSSSSKQYDSTQMQLQEIREEISRIKLRIKEIQEKM